MTIFSYSIKKRIATLIALILLGCAISIYIYLQKTEPINLTYEEHQITKTQIEISKLSNKDFREIKKKLLHDSYIVDVSRKKNTSVIVIKYLLGKKNKVLLLDELKDLGYSAKLAPGESSLEIVDFKFSTY